MALATISPAHAASFDLNSSMTQLRAIPAASEISEADEILLGRDLAGRILGATPLVDDEALQRYVNSVGGWIASQSERADLTWRFGVVDSAILNAYAAPGGYVFITRALYDTLEDEAQLAGVLGHAIASIVRRHHVTVHFQSAQISAMSDLAAATMSRRGDIHKKLAEFGGEVFVRGLHKTAVFEADHMAVVLAARAGYSPDAFLEVLQTLHSQRESMSDAEIILSTHPLPAERLEKLSRITENLPTGLRPMLRFK